MAIRTRTSQERQDRAEQNRRALLAVEVGFLALLLGRRGQIGSAGFQSGAATAIHAGRENSRRAARLVVLGDLLSLGMSAEGRSALLAAAATDAARAVAAASSLTSRIGTLLGAGAKPAEVRTAIAPAMERIAATESAHAYNGEREELAREAGGTQLFKVWDSVLDRRTCPTCSGLDGTIVALSESFPHSQPVHPYCRCTFAILRADEVGGAVTFREIGS